MYFNRLEDKYMYNEYELRVTNIDKEKFIKDICKNQVNQEDNRENRGKI